MGRVDDIARRFSLAGVLDENARAREKYPIVELDVASIADHPDNGAYSMDGDAIRSLADSIRRDGLTDIPLVRRMEDGSFQMISGHRRKAAFALLAARRSPAGSSKGSATRSRGPSCTPQTTSRASSPSWRGLAPPRRWASR